MRYVRSFLLGSTVIVIVAIASALIYHFTKGTCSIGSFLCDNQTKCIPQQNFCDTFPDCVDGWDENILQCGDYQGSNMFIHQLVSKSWKLSEKNASMCQITNMHQLPTKCTCDVKILDCKNANLKTVPFAPSSNHLVLNNNYIKLKEGVFEGLDSIETLILNKNRLSSIPNGVFSGLKNLKRLYLRNNSLTKVEMGFFDGLDNLLWLFFDNNEISEIDLPSLPLLNWLDFANNKLKLDNNYVFPDLPSLFELILSDNLIEVVANNTFRKLNNLHLLQLDNNKIRHIEIGAFENLTNLRELNLSNNMLETLQSGVLRPLQNLTSLYLSNNRIKINSYTLQYLSTNLYSIHLLNINAENIDFPLINSMPKLKYIELTNFHDCSMVPNAPRCSPNTDGVSDSLNLLSKQTLRVTTWMISIMTILGNSLVLWGRGTSRDENRALSFLIRNLAVADMLMGIYLLVIGIQDVQFRNNFKIKYEVWTRSGTCIFIGMLAMISSEVSMLILAFMSVERFLLIVNPLSGYARLNSSSARKTMIIIWSAGIMLAVLPIFYWRKTTMFYGMNSGMCFPLYIMEKYPIGWQYSVFVFLVVNLIELLMIATAYSGMFLSIWHTRRAAIPTSVEECEFAVRFFFIVFTNASCWAPIICMKILNFFDIILSADAYAWLVVFALPLNSAINPLLYTFTTPKYRDQLLSLTMQYSANRSSNGDTESSRTSSNKNINCTIIGGSKNNILSNLQQQTVPLDPLASNCNSSHSIDHRH